MKDGQKMLLETVSEPHLFAEVKGVPKNIQTETLLKDLKSKYSIVDALRMKSKDDTNSLTVRIELDDSKNLDNLVKNGVYHDDRHYRVFEW